ncbi:RNA methyltransferase [Candidatus Berkelbacteria bacterium]|uniref:RNA methyltransferase n=1 Tax=Candidatus Berkelbacteria bacterium CG10_big_fil_rev_8_21_14_0_10_43_14 TaxID=1974515 RepID=A0A2M6R8M4_9BACT|nr:RNA methyltransferase [Candidatus Berkelbacteria bacterium]OIP06487.1 MAG: hypothetical protein AUK41_02425 [Candidatus Berkelbacteria bacterium CG2_30_43_20]PIS06889.1 MAG: RNA methyltransferase [Candidatus Berkelbacteria bacterium CG10_big_fil_rev_8_21_14_0_10_43_14]PIU86943.1 MAG: RNA methyltransferase [Candidatus Berkelbacteria bacterium CG06_land_8_20_14_3_00_43_10]
MILVLENIRSSHNVGSILRTADAVGASEVYLCGVTPAPIDRFGLPNTRLIKVSLGAETTVTWEHYISTKSAITLLAKQGFTLIALEQSDNAIEYTSQKLSRFSWEKSALILGEEVHGLTSDILSRVDMHIEIPMYGTKESLNVAVACGIALYRLKEIMEN